MTLLGRTIGVGALVSAIVMSTTVAPLVVPGAETTTAGFVSGDQVSTTVTRGGIPMLLTTDAVYAEGWKAAEEQSSLAGPDRGGRPQTLVEVAEPLFETAARNVSPEGSVFYAPWACFSTELCGEDTTPTPQPVDRRPTGPLYVDTTSRAAYEAARLQSEGKTVEAADIRVIAEQPQAVWINGNDTGAALTAMISAHRDRADAEGQQLVVVTYAIPFRDCGSYSAGGLTAEQYPGWNQTVADALRGSGAIVIVEPDGLTGVTQEACASVAQSRPAMIKNAVETLAAAGLNVYIDAGHSNWVSDAQMADLLTQAGIASARGFATNVSNYRTAADEQAWAQRVSDRLGGKRFVIDVSRNGNGPNNEWCNPSGRALGVNPTLEVDDGSLDALLWVKRPGESDGTCNGGPTAGHWWHDYAIGLMRNR